jgi:hypothetical protein
VRRFKKCGNIEVLKSYGPLWPVTRLALPLHIGYIYWPVSEKYK